jgi:hypothetical protein
MTDLSRMPQSFKSTQTRKLDLKNIGKFISLHDISITDKTYKEEELPPASIPEMPGVIFTHYQRSAAKRLLDLEEKAHIMLESKDKIVDLYYNTLSLTLQSGSGKTMIMLYVMCLRFSAPKRPEIRVIKPYRPDPTSDEIKESAAVKMSYQRQFKPNLLIVATSVVYQFIYEIETFTNFKYFVANNKSSMVKLINIIENGTVNDYDIILVRNGIMSMTQQLPEGEIVAHFNDKLNTYIPNVLANITGQWNRIWRDDFGIKESSVIGLPSARSTILVSATLGINAKNIRGNNHKTNQSCALDNRYPFDTYSNYLLNGNLLVNLNINCSKDYIAAYTNLSEPKFFRITFVQKALSKTLGLLSGINDEKTETILEMLEAGAIDQACKEAGAHENSYEGVCKKLLEGQFEKFRDVKRVLKICDKIYKLIENNKLKDAKFNIKKETYGKKKLLAGILPKYKFSNLNNLLKEVETEYKNLEKEYSSKIDTMKDNIKFNVCPVCRGNITEKNKIKKISSSDVNADDDNDNETKSNADSDSDSSSEDESAYLPKSIAVKVKLFKEEKNDHIILLCCGAVGCAKCISHALNLQSKNKFNNKCPSCTQMVTMKNIVYLGSDFDMANMLENIEIKDEELNVPLEIVSEEKIAIPAHRYKKEHAIVDIINGNKLSIAPVETKKNIEAIMTGNLPYKRNFQYHKVIVFNKFTEGISILEEKLNKANIKFITLKGRDVDKAKQVRQFQKWKKSNCCMLVNSSQDCAGLNLTFATDVICTHSNKNKGEEAQSIGRAQRIGRNPEISLHVYELVFEGEK